jgi:3-phosphoglycerate kinase
MKYLSRLPVPKIRNKRVLARVDFNVTLDGRGKILDDFRIKACLPTIRHLIKNRAKIVLVSHLSKSQLTLDNKKNQKASLRGISRYLARLLGRKVFFAPNCRGEKVKKAVSALRAGEVLLLENLRFCPEEEKNDIKFARELAGLADFYVNDGFAVSHRAHASVVGVTKYLPSFAGLLLEREMKNLDRPMENPFRPLAVVIGGAKVSTKIKLIENFLKKKSDVLLGGVIANTVLCAKGLSLGKSPVEPEIIAKLRKLNLSDVRLHLPIDVLVSRENGRTKIVSRAIRRVEGEDIIFDIGPETAELFSKIIKEAKMIVWNGPMGYFEKKEFSRGTAAIARAIASARAFSIVGGGDTAIILRKLGLLGRYSFVSTGGGAMLEYLAGEKLPGIEALKQDRKKYFNFDLSF